MSPSCILVISRSKAELSSCLGSDKFFGGATFEVEHINSQVGGCRNVLSEGAGKLLKPFHYCCKSYEVEH